MLSAVARTFVLSLVALAVIVSPALAAPPANDDYANAIALPTPGGTNTQTIDGSTLEASETPTKGVDSYNNQDWAHTVWWKWTLPATASGGIYTNVDVCSSNLNTEPHIESLYMSAIPSTEGINGVPARTGTSGCGTPVGQAANLTKFDLWVEPGETFYFAVGSATASATGDVTINVRTAPFTEGRPTLTGDPYVGSTLTLTDAPWNGLNYGFYQMYDQWMRCLELDSDSDCYNFTPPNGPTKQYTLTNADFGYFIRVRQSGLNNVGTAAAVTSTSTLITVPPNVEPPRFVDPPLPPPEPPRVDPPKPVVIVALDTDFDGQPDATDPDDDNDGIPDVLEIAFKFSPLMQDSNGNGVLDPVEICRIHLLCMFTATAIVQPKVTVVSNPRTTSITGSSADDILLSMQAANRAKNPVVCNGIGGNDACIGSIRNDACVAGSGNDYCGGGGGNDSCMATSGIDRCAGGFGKDTCIAKLVASNARLVRLGLPVPKVTCDGGAGNDTCSASTVSPPVTTIAMLERMLQEDRGAKLTCNGGSGNDTCAVAPRTSELYSIDLKCSGETGADTCVAKDAMEWTKIPAQLPPHTPAWAVEFAVVQAAAQRRSSMRCDGGPGNDLLITANGTGGDVVDGGPDYDTCIVDVNDTVSNCEKLYRFRLNATVEALDVATSERDRIEALRLVEVSLNSKQLPVDQAADITALVAQIQDHLNSLNSLNPGMFTAIGT